MGHELLRRLHGRPEPLRVLLAHGDPMHAATPYAMAAQLVRQAANLRDGDPIERLREQLWTHVAELLPAAHAARVNDFLGELVGAAFEDEGRLPLRAARHDAAAMSDQIARAFQDIMGAWCKNVPLALVLDNCHLSDAPSMRVLDGPCESWPAPTSSSSCWRGPKF